MTPATSSPSLLGLIYSSLRRRWPLVLVYTAISAVVAFVGGQTLGRDTWKAESTLRYTPQGVYVQGREVYRPPNNQTFVELMKSTAVLDEAIHRSEVTIPRSWLEFRLDIDIPFNSDLITLSLEWSNPEEAQRVLDGLIAEVIESRTRSRADQLDRTAEELEQARRDTARELAELETHNRNVLALERSQDPLGDLAKLEPTIQRVQGQLEDAQRREREKLREIDLYRQEFLNEQRGPAPIDQQRLIQIATLETELETLGDELENAEAEQDRKSRMYAQRIITVDELESATQSVRQLQREIDLKETLLDTLKNPPPEQVEALSPFAVKKREAEIEREIILQEIDYLTGTLTEHQEREAELVQLVARFDPVLREEQRLRTELEARQEELATIRSQQGERVQEILVSAAPHVGDTPASSSHSKWMIGVFGLAMLGLIVGLTGLDVYRMSRTSRGVAWRLGLPILADYSPQPGQRTLDPAPAQTRALAMRLCQKLPEPGSLVLFTPLQASVRTDRLAAELAAYLAGHRERVLILDVALSQESGWINLLGAPAEEERVTIFERLGPTRSIPQLAEAAPGPATPSDESAILFDTPTPPTGNGYRPPPLSMAGLSAAGISGCLDDPRRAPNEFVFSTQIPLVDYLPVGDVRGLAGVMALSRLRRVINEMRKHYTLILMMAPPLRERIDQEVLAESAQSVVLVGPDLLPSFRPIADLVEGMRSVKVPLAGLVIWPEDTPVSVTGSEPAPPAPPPLHQPATNGALAPAWAARVN